MKIQCLANPFDIGMSLRIHRLGKLNNPNAIQWPDSFSPTLKEKLATLGTFKVVRKGQRLSEHLHAGALCIIVSGGLKTQLCNAEGTNVILGFYLPGDILHLPDIDTALMPYETVALSTSQLFLLSTKSYEVLMRGYPELLQFHNQVLQTALLEAQRHAILTGSLDSDQKLAYFLVNISARMRHQQFASTRFHLPMSRVEVSQHLFLSPETVSRSVSRFQLQGYLEAHRCDICIHNLTGLLEVLCTQPECSAHVAHS